MQNVINSVKGTALGVAEYLTPILKVQNSPLLKTKLKSSPILGIEISRNWRLNTRRIRSRRRSLGAPLPDMAMVLWR